MLQQSKIQFRYKILYFTVRIALPSICFRFMLFDFEAFYSQVIAELIHLHKKVIYQTNEILFMLNKNPSCTSISIF